MPPAADASLATLPADGLEDAALRLLAGEAGPAQASADRAALTRAVRRTLLTTPEGLADLGRGRPYRLTYGGPFHVQQTLRYLGRDPDNLAERVEGRCYRRFFPVAGHQVPATLTLTARGCRVSPGAPMAPGEALAFHRGVMRLLGLDQPLAPFYRAVAGHPVLGPIVRGLPGVRVPQVPSLWEALCWAVIGQQINLAFAYRLRNRFIALGNGLVPGSHAAAGAPYPFPTPRQALRIPEPAWREAQFSRQKAAYLQGLARAFAEGTLDERALAAAPQEAAEAALHAVHGLGPWSVAYALLRALGRLDALPVGDAGLRAALVRQFGLPTPPDARQQRELMEPFRPWRGLATYYLWKSLERTRQE